MAKLNKNEAGFGAAESLLILVIVAIIGFTGWYVYHAKQTSGKNNTTSASATPTPTSVYAGWKTYTSSAEKATFKYPAGWAIDTADQYVSNDANNSDYTALKSPDGKVVVRWTSLINGFGNEHGDSYPLNTVIDKMPITGATGYYVVSGVTTLDGTTYFPWVAVENDASFGVLSSGVSGNLDLFMGRNNIDPISGNANTALFSTNGPRTNLGVPSFSSKAQAIAYLSNNDVKQAKLILGSLSY